MVHWGIMLLVVGNGLLTASNPYREVPLCGELNEISGWVFINDSTLVAHNDSGDEPALYLIGTNGKLRKKHVLPDIKPVDFEDITTDGHTFVYLGDFGNNLNNRKNLVIYKVRITELISGQLSTPESIRFSYIEQTAFPPKKEQLHFDAEAMVYNNDSLFVFTKCRAKPFNGAVHVYGIPAHAGTYASKRLTTLQTGKRGWLFDSVTGAALVDKQLYLLTYSGVWLFTMESGRQFQRLRKLKMGISQKEALTIDAEGRLYIGDEKNGFGGGKLQIIQPKKKTR